MVAVAFEQLYTLRVSMYVNGVGVRRSWRLGRSYLSAACIIPEGTVGRISVVQHPVNVTTVCAGTWNMATFTKEKYASSAWSRIMPILRFGNADVEDAARDGGHLYTIPSRKWCPIIDCMFASRHAPRNKVPNLDRVLQTDSNT